MEERRKRTRKKRTYLDRREGSIGYPSYGGTQKKKKNKESTLTGGVQRGPYATPPMEERRKRRTKRVYLDRRRAEGSCAHSRGARSPAAVAG